MYIKSCVAVTPIACNYSQSDVSHKTAVSSLDIGITRAPGLNHLVPTVAKLLHRPSRPPGNIGLRVLGVVFGL